MVELPAVITGIAGAAKTVFPLMLLQVPDAPNENARRKYVPSGKLEYDTEPDVVCGAPYGLPSLYN